MRGRPAQRLPAPFAALKKARAEGPGPADPPARPEAERPRRPEKAAPPREATPAASGPNDRIGSLLPGLLRAMVDAVPRPVNGPVVLDQADVLGALAPYHRPKSRFERLVVARLVGEHYLRPVGARDKHGFSAAYALTPKGEQLAASAKR